MNERSTDTKPSLLEAVGTYVALGASGLLWVVVIYTFLINLMGG